MTYETVGGYPASPDIDMDVPEICEKCNRDCPKPCEAFKRIVALEGHISKWSSKHIDWQMGRMSQWKKELVNILRGSGGSTT